MSHKIEYNKMIIGVETTHTIMKSQYESMKLHF